MRFQRQTAGLRYWSALNVMRKPGGDSKDTSLIAKGLIYTRNDFWCFQLISVFMLVDIFTKRNVKWLMKQVHFYSNNIKHWPKKNLLILEKDA